jgi:hypothetical protein
VVVDLVEIAREIEEYAEWNSYYKYDHRLLQIAYHFVILSDKYLNYGHSDNEKEQREQN